MDTNTRFQVDKVEFEQERTKVFQSFLKNHSLTDVTLVNDEDLEVSAHKLILSSVSPVLRKIFERRPQDQPLLFLRGVKSEHLRAMIDYIYTGETSINVSNLNEFIQVGKDLKIVGLTDDDDDDEEEEGGRNANNKDQANSLVLEESSLKIIEAVKEESIIENESSIGGIGKQLSLPNCLENLSEVDKALVASTKTRILTEDYFKAYDRKRNALMVQIKGQLWKCKQCSKEKLKHHLKEHVTSHLDLSTKFSYT